jgi:hypothetical protein
VRCGGSGDEGRYRKGWVDAAHAEIFDCEEFLDAVFERLGDTPDAANVAAVEQAVGLVFVPAG